MYILTCAGRESALSETLLGVLATDWGEVPRIIRDELVPDDPANDNNPIARGHLTVLREILRAEADYALVLEDDVDVNAHLAHNLAAWPPLRDGWLDFATLYNPGLRRLRPTRAASDLPPTKQPDGATWFEVDPATVIGGQARIFSRKCAEFMLSAWPSAGTGQQQDRLMAALASRLGPLWAHAPSLVQHRPGKSTWEGPVHRAWDFDGSWRA